MYIHLTLVPYIGHAGELKTKPTQHSVNELRRIGIQPDMLLCRSEGELGDDIRKKIALFASLGHESVVSAKDVDNIYKVPLWFHRPGRRRPDHRPLRARGRARRPRRVARDHRARRRRHAAGAHRHRRQVRRSSRTPTCRSARPCATRASCTAARSRSTGSTPRRSTPRRRPRRGWPTPTASSSPAASAGAGSRARSAPSRSRASARSRTWAICLGMQIAVSEFARNVAGMPGANSTEFDIETEYPVIDLLPEQKEVTDLGGTMRLGRRPDQAAPRHAHARALRRGRRLRAPPPSLRGVDLACASAWRPPGSSSRARRPTSGWSRSSSCATTRSSSPRSSTPSSSRGPERPAPLFREFVAAALERARSRAPEGGEVRASRAV